MGAEITFEDKSVLNIPPNSPNEFEINQDNVTFSVRYTRDFTFGYQFIPKVDGNVKDIITEKITQKAIKSIGNAIVQIVNTYKISGLNDGSVIEVNDRAHYLSAEGLDSFFGCFPALYYFGQAECENAEIEVVSSIAMNRPEFISLYKLIYRTINLHGLFFNLIKYKVQINRQRKISSANYLTMKFRKLYSLPLNDREYQFKPITVLTDKFLNFITKSGTIPFIEEFLVVVLVFITKFKEVGLPPRGRHVCISFGPGDNQVTFCLYSQAYFEGTYSLVVMHNTFGIHVHFVFHAGVEIQLFEVCAEQLDNGQ